MKKDTKNLIVMNLGIFFLFLIDRFSKWLALNFLEGKEHVLFNFFRLELYLNKGIAFSVPFYLPLLYLINGLIVLTLVLFLIKSYQKRNSIAVTALALIIAGAISNILDRIFQEAVIDFINLKVLPIFNLADVMIIAGVSILVFKVLFSKKQIT